MGNINLSPFAAKRDAFQSGVEDWKFGKQLLLLLTALRPQLPSP